MSVAFHDKIGAPLFQKFHTKTRRRVVDVRKVAGSLGISTCRALLGMHAYTGCDTTSAFAGKGKSSSLTLLTTDRDVTEMFLQVGQDWNLSPELMEQLEAFTCRI